MPLPTITNGFLCAYRGSLYSAQSFEVTFAVLDVVNNASVLAEHLKDPWSDNISPHLSNVVGMSSVAVTPLDGTGEQVVSPFENTGGGGDGTLTPETCIVATLRTGIAGRSNRGRMFLPALTGPDLATGKYTWQSGFVGAMTSAMEAWRADLAAIDAAVGVLSRVESSLRQVTSIAARPPVATQRRRLTGGLIF